ncbi:hypothetical protein BJY52DRAFT_1328991 [Lactarius psammicola]|nr:hypothetical protein BJY52DRAFT_1328991 [Lactarius psammicola]
MYAISTATFVSILALVSSLAGIAQAAPQPQCAETSDVKSGDTCDTLGARLGLSKAEIQSMNSGLSCDGTIPVSTLCIKLSTTTKAPACTKPVTATGTTCDGLASQNGIDKATFVKFNPNVNDDCTNLVPGQEYCLSAD